MLLCSYSQNLIEAGCDEAGRGCLAGPVVAAAVILPRNYKNPMLNDSKKLTFEERRALEMEIKAATSHWAVSEASNQEIDEINILNASFLAMHRAVNKLKIRPNLLLIDGNRFNPHPEIPHECIINGDGQYQSIASASILAKNFRDRLMRNLSQEFPDYCWQTNVGYPTTMHRRAIKDRGLSPFHRKSFRQLPGQHELFDYPNLNQV